MSGTPAPRGPIVELRREHAEVAQPLLRRMEEIADLLESGIRVPPGEIDEGFRLWEEYLHGAHRDRLAALRSPRSARCGPGLEDALENHEHSQRRVARLRELLERYRDTGTDTGALADAIHAGIRVDREWIEFEEEQPFSCLARELTDSERDAMTRALRATGPSIADIEGRVRGFLDRPVGSLPETFEVRCDVGTCPSRATLAFRGTSSEGVHLGPAPPGWVLRTKDRRGSSVGSPPTLAFYCPAHVPRAVPSADRPVSATVV